ncbi:hypothetical protein [Methylobacter sp. S3L5C]|uniref:hypothetical protein n=1 Tax=Methylobacter sp. S3L5C TaxID=2839024 RepID=UPI001FAD8723|nr:hypothetical protein [Methylobacter sp. S3L5C]UOA09664.1 hypothetical protein KKZ03_05080 [Methylobacter sp. S3L5C]
MNNKLMFILTSFCLLCIFLIIVEWLYAEQSQKQILTSSNPTEIKIASDEMPNIELTRQSEESYADLIARPLFIKGRKPIDEPSPEEIQNMAVANIFDWQVNGIYTTKKGLSALFSRSKSKVAKDNHRRVLIGGDLDGWRLTEIHSDKVILNQGNEQKELLLRKPKLKDLSKKPNQPNATQPEDSQPQPAEGELENTNE